MARPIPPDAKREGLENSGENDLSTLFSCLENYKLGVKIEQRYFQICSEKNVPSTLSLLDTGGCAPM